MTTVPYKPPRGPYTRYELDVRAVEALEKIAYLLEHPQVQATSGERPPESPGRSQPAGPGAQASPDQPGP